jgi:hypothetical protein
LKENYKGIASYQKKQEIICQKRNRRNKGAKNVRYFSQNRGKMEMRLSGAQLPTKKDATHHLKDLKAFNPNVKARIKKIAGCRLKR